MAFSLNYQKMDDILAKLSSDYDIYAPVRLVGEGKFSATDRIQYDKITRAEQIVYNEKSDFSPREIISPITQTLFYFTENEFIENLPESRSIIIFARPCDINAFKRLDKIFLENGDFADSYYKSRRDKVHFALLDCKGGWESCFCVSMGTNKTSDYSLAVNFNSKTVEIEVNDSSFNKYFNDIKQCSYQYNFVKKNKIEVELPEIRPEQIEKISDLQIWQEYGQRCKSCGSCTAVCPSCSCFTTRDISYKENKKAGERRRVWASCLHPDFTEMSGGHSYRETAAARIRFRTLHKIYDYKKRFDTVNMCVGCGRCTDTCTQLISFATLLNRLSQEIKKLSVLEEGVEYVSKSSSS